MYKVGKKVNALRYNVLGRNRRDIPIYIFCHHKTGTNLLRKVFIDICARERWKFTSVRYQVSEPPDGDVVVFSHSNIDPGCIKHPYRGIHMIRDPREVIVSAYLYHKRTDEPWCVSKNFEMIGDREYFPVPEFRQHMTAEWKKKHLELLGGLSYQEKIRSFSQEEGIEFEMRNYSAWTIEDMLSWDYTNPNIIEVKMEDSTEDYEALFRKIFEHLRFEEKKILEYLGFAKRHDLGRLDPAALKKISHVRTKDSQTWPKYLSENHLKLFDELYGSDACAQLGYK